MSEEIQFISTESDEVTFIVAESDDILILHDLGEQGEQGPPGITYVDMGTFISGAPDAGEMLTVNLSYGFTAVPSRCILTCKIEPFADAVFTYKMDGVAFATVTVPAGEKVGIWSFTETVVGPGSLDLVCPDPKDITLADISPTLAGVRINP